MNKLIKNKKIISVWLCIMIFIINSIMGDMLNIKGVEVQAASAETADLRFIFTTDLHGRVTTTDYELNKEFSVGSLAKAYTLIEEARGEKEAPNSFTFDLGDVLYDYTTENIFEMAPDEVQPIYKAMTEIGYDAIVLGNHEFDYGYNYIVNQMEKSGLKNKCVVSNLKDSKTGKNVFKENMIITRNVYTSSGSKIKVKVGIIGETVPVLSKKRENYIGVLETEDIVENTRKQARALKKKGADIIVVLAHSGFGSENPTEFSKDASYALTKIDEVDVVLCGHQHQIFPSSEETLISTYSGVDSKTGLVNGKNLVMANDRGQSIGIADLTLKINGTKKSVIKRKSEVRYVKASTEADKVINMSLGKWAEVFEKAAENIVGNVKEGASLNNYFGLVEDTNAIQLANNAKINYAMKTLSDNEKYNKYPIVAASYYNRYGQLSADDYVNIKGQISEANLSAIVPFNRYVFLYEITGNQLREWIEWSASAYETIAGEKPWIDETMIGISNETGLKSLVSEDWLDEWNKFYIFDGISYTIDPSSEPRYNYYGTKINNTKRVVELTYNGVPVTDGMKFILSTESLTGTSYQVLKQIENQAVSKGINKSLNILTNYVKELSTTGDIEPYADYNWKILMPEGYEFIVKASELADEAARESDWYNGDLATINQYSYYKGVFSNKIRDNNGPNIVASSTNTVVTNNNINIILRVTDNVGIKCIKYIAGNYDDKEYLWLYAREIANNIFEITENGIYTIYAEDNNGNKSTLKINIENINRGVLQIPTISSYTNRTTKIKGKAEPGADIFFETEEGNYEGKVESNGTFACEIPSQKSGSIVKVYVKDDLGRSSDKISIVTKRTGANQPELKKLSNNDTFLSGNIRDSDTLIYAIAGNYVYVPLGASELYENCDKFDPNKKISEVDLEVDVDGSFRLYMPPQRYDTKVYVYGIDHVGRTSKEIQTVVKHEAPNVPVIYSVCDAEEEINGYVYDKVKGNIYDIQVTVNGTEYRAKTDENGYFTVQTEKLMKGYIITVYATDVEKGAERYSAPFSYTVKSAESYVSKEEYQDIALDIITNKTQKISGNTVERNTRLVLCINDIVYEIYSDETGYFEYVLSEKLRAGDKVSVVLRKVNGGIIEADVKNVIVGKPYAPEILNKNIYNTTRYVQVLSKERGSVTITVNGVKYTSKQYTYDESLGGYIYDVKIAQVNSGTVVSVFATNSAGNSPSVERIVNIKAPDMPKTSKITKNTVKIIGTVMLIDNSYIEEGEKLTVENTGTRVFAKILGKVYEGKVKDNGSYTIEIPKQPKGISINIWAENVLGKGPGRTVKVV